MSHRLTTIAIRAAVVATALAATASVAVLPATAAPTAPVAPAVTAPVVPTAQTSPAAPTAGRTAMAAATRSSALQNALGKIGAPYRWGASGPSAFDCSGLVSWAFRQEGVSLPRTSRAMASAGVPVSRPELRPGDLVLFYRPVSHVAIYVGDGRVVHASTSGTPVKVSDMDAMPFHSARRV